MIQTMIILSLLIHTNKATKFQNGHQPTATLLFCVCNRLNKVYNTKHRNRQSYTKLLIPYLKNKNGHIKGKTANATNKSKQ